MAFSFKTLKDAFRPVADKIISAGLSLDKALTAMHKSDVHLMANPSQFVSHQMRATLPKADANLPADMIKRPGESKHGMARPGRPF